MKKAGRINGINVKLRFKPWWGDQDKETAGFTRDVVSWSSERLSDIEPIYVRKFRSGNPNRFFKNIDVHFSHLFTEQWIRKLYEELKKDGVRLKNLDLRNKKCTVFSFDLDNFRTNEVIFVTTKNSIHNKEYSQSNLEESLTSCVHGVLSRDLIRSQQLIGEDSRQDNVQNNLQRKMFLEQYFSLLSKQLFMLD